MCKLNGKQILMQKVTLDEMLSKKVASQQQPE